MELTPVDLVGNYNRGLQFKEKRKERERANALQSYVQNNAEGIMSGDANALGGYIQQGGDVGNAFAMKREGRISAQQDQERQISNMYTFSKAVTGLQDGDSVGYEAAEAFALENGLITPEQAAKWDVSQLPQLRSLAAEGVDTLKAARLDLDWAKLEQDADQFGQTLALRREEIEARRNGGSFRPATADEAAEYGVVAGQFDSSGRFYPTAKPQSGERIITDGQGGVTIERGGAVGGGGFGRKVNNELEAKYADSYDLHTRLDRVGEIAGIDPQTGRMSEDAARMLTYEGQAEDWLATQAEKLGREPSDLQREAIQLRTRFTTSVEQLFNAYRKEITGAAAAVQELERLKKSFINVDMSPTQFEAAYSEYRGELQRAMRISAKLRRDGVDPKSKEGGDLMDRLYLGGADDSASDRFGELAASGMDEEEIYSTLIREGYSQ